MRALGLLLAAAVLSVGNPGGLRQATTAAAAAAVAKPATVHVKMDGMKFVPAELTVHTGDTIVWTNTDIVAHTVTSKTGLFDSKLIPPGGTWKYVAKKAGTFPYQCSYHLPMTATFTVR
jgi:plastocyanin